MPERAKKQIRDVLRSGRFQREVSVLLFCFAAVNAVFSLVLFAASGSDEAALRIALTYGAGAVVYAVLAIFIRRGSTKVLIFTGLLFLIDTILTLLGPSWEDARSMLFARGLLIFVLIRYISRERTVAQ